MLAAHSGPLLPGLDDSEWVQQLRDALNDSGRAALEPALVEAELRGEYALVVRLCSQALRVLPHDLELMTRRISAAQHTSMTVELAQFQSDLKHSLN